MTLQSSITDDELLGLVAGTLSREEFMRVAQAVKKDVALQAQLAVFEQLRSVLIQAMAFEKSQASVTTFAENVAMRAESADAALEKAKTANIWMGWISNFFSGSSTPVRFAYSLVAIQAIGIAWLLSGALQINDGSTANTRTAGPDTKQLGTAPASITFSISFDPATPESDIRGLLLELEAQIISGPSQLGQYKIVVAHNRSRLALLKLREANFVEQVTELAKEAAVPNAQAGSKK